MRSRHAHARVARATFAALLGSPLVVACSIGEETRETVIYPARTVTEIRKCDSPFVAPPLDALTACGDERGAKGHCYDASKTSLPTLLRCAGDAVCVPDAVLASNGQKLKSCKFFIGDAPGVCMSLLADDVFAHKDQIQRDVCDEDERCVPCVNPTNGEDTHTCDPIGVHEKACAGGPGAADEPCCHGAGSCMREDGVPEDSRGKLSRDICRAGEVCAPAALVSGEPVKCDALGFSGVCLDVCFAEMIKPSGPILRSSCRPTEVCLPCIVGKGQGMPGCD